MAILILAAIICVLLVLICYYAPDIAPYIAAGVGIVGAAILCKYGDREIFGGSDDETEDPNVITGGGSKKKAAKTAVEKIREEAEKIRKEAKKIRKHTKKLGGNSGVEYEARWLDVDVGKIRERLQELGANKVHSAKLYRRYVYPLERGYARVRLEYGDNGQVVTMTTKSYENPDFPLENEVTVHEDFETAKKFLESLNMKPKAYHETVREKYTGIAGCNEVAIDTIPGVNPYVEIDCKSEERLKEMADQLGLNMADAKYGAYGNVYAEEYGIDKKWINDVLDELTFETVAEKVGPKVEKNREKFDQITAAGKPHLE